MYSRFLAILFYTSFIVSCASTTTEGVMTSEEFEAQEQANPIKKSRKLKNRGSSATLPPEHKGDFYQENY